MLEKKVAWTETTDICWLSDNWLEVNEAMVEHLSSECQLDGFSPVTKQFLEK